ncbi:MAG: bifunctional phosphopantothenoylcysteine decarboxylase/phosphopantothenate--cysteine ligase CoaBC [Thermoplasmata archaeon]|nr:bifunctional phosphopantothenoylcysteine decarboxylase/phosphopantothenate--cysteine ligase CoaBC [Thermoplasmata archaeon]MBR6213710.1 bifunctional phosphopantothenoylcysteine decarboxylase/phosphopantothenate--cysteine ligase CoaBC [Candidatus Methanomethylophilaceae archaeon]
MTHPADEIYCEKSASLEGKTIVMGITGSIAAVECFGTIRELIRRGADVIPVMTKEAQKLVTPDSLYFASGNQPVTELTGLTEHITLLGDRESADLLLIYPATANTISKIANGIDDTTVTSMASVAIGEGVPVAIAPAMHQAMFDNPAVSDNIEKLKSWGIAFIGPRLDGVRAKVASTEEIVNSVERIVGDAYLKGKRVLVIGGRSEEPIDSMRVITNRSSGLMAVKLAEAAFRRGAEVDLWMGGCSVQLPGYIDVKRFSSVSDLISMLNDIDHDIVIVPAALSDFKPEEIDHGKITSSEGFDLGLIPVQKVLPLIRKKCGTVIGFKAESGLTKEKLIDKARQRLDEYDLTAVIANDTSSAGKSDSSVILVTKDAAIDISGTKAHNSEIILDDLFGDYES